MAFLGKGRKEDLLQLATELNLNVNQNMKILELKTEITGIENYDEGFVKEMFLSIIEERKRKEEMEERKRKEEMEEKNRKEEMELAERKRKEEMELAERKAEREFELEKIKIEAEIHKNKMESLETNKKPTRDFQNLIHKYDVKEDISLYFILFERQARRAEIPEENWVIYFLGLMPSEITEMIAREAEEKVQTYKNIKELLLKRFKLTPEKFRQLFSKHVKAPEKTWQDYYYELSNYFDGWISGLEVKTFEQIRDLMITDQMKKRAPQEFKEFYVDKWPTITSPIKLAEMLEEFEDVKGTIRPKHKTYPKVDQGAGKYRSELKKEDRFKFEKKDFRGRNYDNPFEKKKLLRCYECNSTEHLRPQCPKFKKVSPMTVNNV